MTTRASNKEVDIVAEARAALAALKKDLTKIAAEDKAKGKTAGVNAAFAKDFATALSSYDATTKSSGKSKTGASASSAAEAAARAPLAAALKSIRDDVADAAPDDDELQRAFGRGANLGAKSTAALVAAAEAIEGAFEARATDVKSAGVNATRIKALAKLRATLTDADTSQKTALSARASGVVSKVALVAQLKQFSTRTRKRLASLGDGKSTLPRHTATKRGAKP